MSGFNILPPQLFLTPFTNPWERPMTGSSSIGEAGEMMQNAQLQREKMALARQQMAADAARSQAQLGIDQQRVTGQNRYNDDLIAARREESGARAATSKDKRMSELTDMLRKAAHAGDWSSVDLIRQQMGSMGFASEESPSMAPEAQNPDLSFKASEMGLPPDLLAAPTSSPKGQKPTAPPSKSFLQMLGAEVGGGPTEPTGGAPEPMPWGDLGIDAPPAKPARGGKFTIKDARGLPVSVIDVPLEQSKTRDAVSGALDPFVTGASNAEEKAAAEMARKAAVAAAMVEGTAPDKAAEIGRNVYDKKMNRFFQEKRPGSVATGGGAAGGMSKQEQVRSSVIFKETLDVIKESRAQDAVAKAREDLSKTDKLETLLSHTGDGNFTQNAALSQYTHDLIGGAQSQGEIDRTLGGAGKAAQLQLQVDRYINGGKVPDEILDGLRAVAAASRKAAQSRVDAAGRGVYTLISRSKGVMTPEERMSQAELARDYVIDAPIKEPGGKANTPGKQKAIDDAKELVRKSRELDGGH